MRKGVWCARSEMDVDLAEKAKARRAQRLLYALMIVMIVSPLAVYWLRNR